MESQRSPASTLRRLIFSCLAIQGVGLILGLIIPPGEATIHGIVLLIATVILLFPGSIAAVPLTTLILPRHIVESQREDSILNLFTAIALNCLLLGIVAGFLRRRKPKGFNDRRDSD
jgi:hypothetical protein